MNNQRIANATARKAGFGTATTVIFIRIPEPCVLDHTRYGYRKRTTGQYVPNAYMDKFGWKNCYYQSAETVVALPMHMEADHASF